MTNGWPVAELKDMIEGLYDGPHATPKESSSGSIFLGIKNVTEDGRLDLSDIRYIAEDDMAKWTKRVTPRKNDIVFSYEATLHRYAKIPDGFNGCLGRRMALVRVNEEVCDVDFLFSYFLSPLWRYEVERHILTGATVDRIPLTHVPNFKVHLPPLPAQKKIAGVLSAYNRLIENNLKRIKLLEEMAQITYEEWFVRLRFPGYDSTPINPTTGLPEGWLKTKLQDMLILQRGFDLPSQNRISGNIPIYASTGISGHHNQAKVQGPGVLTGRSGTLGNVMYIKVDHWPLNTTLWVKEFKEISPIFAYYILNGLNLENYNSGVAVPTLNRNDIHHVSVTKPSKTIIDSFTTIINPIFNGIDKLNIQNQFLREARDILLPRLMTGVIDVESYNPADLLKEVA